MARRNGRKTSYAAYRALGGLRDAPCRAQLRTDSAQIARARTERRTFPFLAAVVQMGVFGCPGSLPFASPSFLQGDCCICAFSLSRLWGIKTIEVMLDLCWGRAKEDAVRARMTA